MTASERPAQPASAPVTQVPGMLSPSGAALLLLCWLRPTDRALAGWRPADSWKHAPQGNEEHFVRWLWQVAGPSLQARSTERDDLEEVAARGHCRVSGFSETARTGLTPGVRADTDCLRH